MARAALEQLQLRKIIFIPTGAQHYRNPAAASDEQRVAMLELALGGEPRYEIDTRELATGATGYTVDTLKALHLEKPTLLMGADQYAKLGSWYRPEEVRRLSRIAVFARPGIPLEEGVKTITMPPMKISASEIRARVARGEDISPMVPPAVARHIAANGLYR
jgi:nicotinate-nucleotide adenylyltransferase